MGIMRVPEPPMDGNSETKTIKSRIIQKHDTEANWQKALYFTPKKGEIIIYDIDSSHDYERIKIGDGEHIPNDLPFVTDNYYTKSETDTKLNGKQAQLDTTQLAAVNSGITSEKVTKYDNYQSQINSKYEKPTGGIPKTDLSSAVQDSLGKADSALQSHQEITTGGANGTIAVDGTDVAVKGLKALAYKDSLTKSDVGLGNVDNTSDKEKPISTATQAALDEKQASLTTAQLNAVDSGITSAKVATYDGYKSQIDGKYTKPTDGIPKTDLASGVQTSLGKADTALQTHQKIATGSANGTISVDGTDVSVKGLGSLAYKNSLTKSDVGLGNVDNTSDANKPVSTATQTELDKKADLFVKETVIDKVSSGKSYELGSVSSMVNFPTINAVEFTSINDVSQICFKASANFVISMPSTTYLCIGDGLSSDKTKLTTVSGKSYCITVGYTPFGIQIVSAIVDVL